MKNRIFTVIIVLSICISSALIIQSCKDNTPVQTNNNNNNNNPNAPVLNDPPNHGAIQTITPVLKWNSFTSAVSYRLQVSLDANFAGTMLIDSAGITAVQFNVTDTILHIGSNIYWRVQAVLNSGTSDWSAVWRFNVIFGAPAAPNLIFPANGSTNDSTLPLFDWSDVPTAEFYRIQVSKFPNFSLFVLDSTDLTVSQLQCPLFVLTTGTQYYWRVNASNTHGLSTGPWSSTWNFTTVAGPEPNSISGTVTFADTSIIHPPGYYFAAAYTQNGWPPGGTPSAVDSVIVHKKGNVYTANYQLRRLLNGNYIICLQAFTTAQLNPLIQGIYGCDTAHVQFSTCPQNPAPVQIFNNTGRDNINFLAWADTSKRIF